MQVSDIFGSSVQRAFSVGGAGGSFSVDDGKSGVPKVANLAQVSSECAASVPSPNQKASFVPPPVPSFPIVPSVAHASVQVSVDGPTDEEKTKLAQEASDLRASLAQAQRAITELQEDARSYHSEAQVQTETLVQELEAKAKGSALSIEQHHANLIKTLRDMHDAKIEQALKNITSLENNLASREAQISRLEHELRGERHSLSQWRCSH